MTWAMGMSLWRVRNGGGGWSREAEWLLIVGTEKGFEASEEES